MTNNGVEWADSDKSDTKAVADAPNLSARVPECQSARVQQPPPPSIPNRPARAEPYKGVVGAAINSVEPLFTSSNCFVANNLPQVLLQSMACTKTTTRLGLTLIPECSGYGIYSLRDFPKHEILTYGYKAEAQASSGEGSSDRILSHALTLVAELYATRDLSNAISRPIIFICHGLGGILVKRALAFSNTSSAKQVEHRRSIFTATYAIMFFSTPYTGMSDAALRTEAQLMPTAALSQLSSALAKGSQTLQDINDQFAPLTKRFSIYLFWEQLESEFGTTQGYVVAQDSADPGWENVERAGTYADHSHMCKFTSVSQDGFKLVLSACRRYVQKAPQVVLARWQEDRGLVERERKQEAAELLRHGSGLSLHGGPSPIRNVHFVVPRSASSLFTGRADTANLLRQKIVSTPFE